MVVLEEGSLSEAMRSSMSVPGVFSPVERDGRLLIDGGVVNNLPADVAKQIGAEVVIAVDVTTPLQGKEKLWSALGASRQMITILNRANSREHLPFVDVLVVPELGERRGSDFSNLDRVILQGELGAREMEELLLPYALGAEEYQDWTRRVRNHRSAAETIEFVDLHGLSRVDERRVSHRLAVRDGEILDLGRIQADLSRIYEIGEFETVGFRMVHQNGKRGLAVRAKEKRWGPDYIRFGFTLRDDLSGRSYFNILINYTRTSINALGAEWRNDFRFGRTRLVLSEIYQPLDFAETFFVAPIFKHSQRIQDAYEGEHKVAEIRVRRTGAGCDLGARIGSYAELRTGIRWRWIAAKPRIGTPDLGELDERLGGITARILLDRLDSTTFPSSGTYGRCDFVSTSGRLGSDSAYDRLSGSLVVYKSLGSHTLFLGTEGGTNLGRDLPPYEELRLGGLYSFSGLREGQLRGPTFLLGRGGYQRKVGRLPSAVGWGVFLGAWMEAGNVWQRVSSIGVEDLLYAGTLEIGADTRLGPVSLAYGRAEGGRDRFHLSLGFKNLVRTGRVGD
jgi:NTE family protein